MSKDRILELPFDDLSAAIKLVRALHKSGGLTADEWELLTFRFADPAEILAKVKEERLTKVRPTPPSNFQRSP